MVFLTAFVAGGIICTAFQALMMLTKIEPPKLVIASIVLGGILGASGIMAAIMSFNAAGVQVMAMGAGGAVCDATTLALSGDPRLMILILGIYLAVIVIGIAGGIARWKLRGSKTDR